MYHTPSNIYFSNKSNYVSPYVGGREDKDKDDEIIKQQSNSIKNNGILTLDKEVLPPEDKYDEYRGFLISNGLYDSKKSLEHRNTIKIEYEHIDSRARNITNSNVTNEPVLLRNNPLTFGSVTKDGVVFDNYLWISTPLCSLAVSDKINFTGFSPVTNIIRCVLTSLNNNNIIFTNNSAYVKININPNIVNSTYDDTLQSKIDSYDFSDVTVTISGFKGSSPNNMYFFNIPIAVLNDTFQIYLVNPDDIVKPWTGTYFFIKLPFAFSDLNTQCTNDGYNISFQFNHMCGVPNYFINADYPFDKAHQVSHQIVASIKTNQFAIVLRKEWLGDNNKFSFGGNLLYYSQITGVNMGYSYPNNYVVNLSKEYKRLTKMTVINTIFPATENVFNNFENGGNTCLYWQNRSDGDILYKIKIDPGTYDVSSLKFEIESKIALVPRIVEDQFDTYEPYNYMTVDFNTDNNVTTFKSYRKYIFTLPPIVGIMDNDGFNISPSINIGTYNLQILQPSHNLNVGDTITFYGMIDHYGIPASKLNSSFIVSAILDIDNYIIVVSGVNINELTILNNTGGGFDVFGMINNYFRLVFTDLTTMGTNIGFRNVGSDIAITPYNHIIRNTDPYFNEPSTDQNGNPTDYHSGRIILSKSPYFYMCCSELKNKILQSKNSDSHIDNIICKINCSTTKNNYYFNTYVYTPITFYEPINLNKMSISFYTPDGKLVDFGNTNHSFTLQFEHTIEKPLDTYIDSTTGIKY